MITVIKLKIFYYILKFLPHLKGLVSCFLVYCNGLTYFVGCTSADSKEILEFLQSLPASEIMKHLHLFSFVIKDDRYPDPHEAYKTDKINPVDLMVQNNLKIPPILV